MSETIALNARRPDRHPELELNSSLKPNRDVLPFSSLRSARCCLFACPPSLASDPSIRCPSQCARRRRQPNSIQRQQKTHSQLPRGSTCACCYRAASATPARPGFIQEAEADEAPRSAFPILVPRILPSHEVHLRIEDSTIGSSPAKVR